MQTQVVTCTRWHLLIAGYLIGLTFVLVTVILSFMPDMDMGPGTWPLRIIGGAYATAGFYLVPRLRRSMRQHAELPEAQLYAPSQPLPPLPVPAPPTQAAANQSPSVPPPLPPSLSPAGLPPSLPMAELARPDFVLQTTLDQLDADAAVKLARRLSAARRRNASPTRSIVGCGVMALLLLAVLVGLMLYGVLNSATPVQAPRTPRSRIAVRGSPPPPPPPPPPAQAEPAAQGGASGLAVGGALLVYFGAFATIVWVAKRTSRQHNQRLAPWRAATTVQITASADTLSYEWEGLCQTFDWAHFKQWIESEHLFVLVGPQQPLSTESVSILPKAIFTDPQQIAAFRQMLARSVLPEAGLA